MVFLVHLFNKYSYKYKAWRVSQKSRSKERNLSKRVRAAAKTLNEIDAALKSRGYTKAFREALWNDFVYTGDKGKFIRSLIGD